MTGTSMDGIDISMVRTNGIKLERLNENYFYKYNDKTKDFLLRIVNDDIKVNLERKKILDKIVTEEHYLAINKLNILKKSDLIGFHGQTIYHNPKNKVSLQLGDPKKLAQMLNKNVIFDFRTKDIELGGEGAPLAPIYHKFIIESLNLELPSAILNIGGIANLTFWDGKTLLGFDTGPGNALMDQYIKKTYNEYYDKDGKLASLGIPNKDFINKFINHSFFFKSPPKSIDRNFFKTFYDELLDSNLSIPNKMATLAEFTVETINIGFNLIPQKVKNILITGGGYRNAYLMERLKRKLNINIINEYEVDFEFDYIESELIAFLAGRSFYKLPITFPSTTGCSKASSGGKLYI